MISVVIPVFDESNIGECLKSVFSLKGKYEVIIVDSSNGKNFNITKKNKIKFAQDASFADKLALNYWYTKNVFDIAINPQDMTNIEQEDEQMARVNELIENTQHDMRKADPEICIHFIKSGETTLPKTYDEETKNATHAQIKQLIDRHYFVHVNEEAH